MRSCGGTDQEKPKTNYYKDGEELTVKIMGRVRKATNRMMEGKIEEKNMQITGIYNKQMAKRW